MKPVFSTNRPKNNPLVNQFFNVFSCFFGPISLCMSNEIHAIFILPTGTLAIIDSFIATFKNHFDE